MGIGVLKGFEDVGVVDSGNGLLCCVALALYEHDDEVGCDVFDHVFKFYL